MNTKQRWLYGVVAWLCGTGFLGLSMQTANAQTVGACISENGALPNTNAMLDIVSPATGDGKGLLIPRITASQRTTSSAALPGGLLNDSGQLRGGPAQGLMVFQTDGTQGFYFNSSVSSTPSWVYMGDFMANGSVPMTGRLNLNGHNVTNVNTLHFNSDDIQIGGNALSYSTTEGGVAIGRNATARYRQSGVAIGTGTDADYNGIAIGFMADGQYSNIAIGFLSSAYSGYDRITIGRCITNRFNNSAAIRGTLYLDGGTGVMVRSQAGTGSWSLKAFAIDHPLDPENKVLRHFCLEGPDVWNVYAGNAQIVNGQALVELPDYYPVLNKAGSEIVSLTPWGPARVWVEKVTGNLLALAADADVKVSWTVKVLRNDPACLEDLKKRPVEQLKSELSPDQAEMENRIVNTGEN